MSQTQRDGGAAGTTGDAGGTTGDAGGTTGDAGSSTGGADGRVADATGTGGVDGVDSGVDSPTAPETKIPTANLDFGRVSCGVAGDPVTVSFANSGNAALHYRASIAIGGIFSMQGAGSDGSLSADVSPGASATLTVATGSVPTTTASGASLQGTLVIVTNAVGAESVEIALILTAEGGTCTLVCGMFTKCTPTGDAPYCANTATDNSNCGSCGQSCGNGQVCGGGACGLACGDLTKCTPTGGASYCANTVTDNANCGSCGNSCADGQVCSAGACALTCGALTKCAPSGAAPYCANTTTDNANCGTCGNSCGAGQVCSASACALTCGALTKCAPSSGAPYCANTATDNANCGTCGNSCGSGQVCDAGACALTCGALTKCAPSSGAPYCANTTTDSANCGTCGNSCASGQVCGGGVCALTCGALTKCAPSGGAPYCANTTTDNANCGTCGTACSAGHACSGGSCTLTCGSLTKCTPTSGAPYCANTTTDNADCGTCGNACGAGQVCSGGSCTLTCGSLTKCTPTSGAPYCANTTTDLLNCGSCGHSCSAGQACIMGTCTATCSPSQTDCGGMCTNTSFDPSNCGTCGHVCTMPQGSSACSGGGCFLTSCDAGYLNCNGTQTDGCEVNKNTDSLHCGACGHACALGETCTVGVCTTNLSQGLLGYWNMDDAPGSTAAADSSANHLDGQVQGPVTFVPGGGKQGSGAATFTGSGFLRVVFPNNAKGQGTGVFIPQGNITFAMWFKTSSATVGGLQVVEGNGAWGSGCDRVIGNGGGAVLNYNVWSEVNMSGGNVAANGVWHHMAYVLDTTGGFRTYVDGMPDTSSATPTGNCGVGCSGFDWASEYWIGTGAGCRFGAGYFVGSIDDVRLYDHVLSAAAVLQLYNATK